ncbi:EP300-interacting inhibitor of differentiation 3 isoform X2 [Harpegnathos saltator]|nr:EP300-interacting inhibitor of differentiation 3 isoform X2 [Harpegnathos saltator]
MQSNRSSSSISNARSPRERKDCLKRALEKTLILQDAVSGSTITKLDEAIFEVDNVTNETTLYDKVFNHQEVLIDSQMMMCSSKVIKTCAVSLTKRMRDYDHVDFAQKVVKYLQEASQDDDDAVQPVNWFLLETRITKLFKKVPNYNTLLGALEPLEKKVPNKRKSMKKTALQAVMKVPDKIVSQTTTEEDSVEQTMRKIRKLILGYCKERQEPLDLFKLIIHPDDFGRTIRNLLYVSFLVKDGVVKLSKDNRGSLVVQPNRKADQQNEHSSNRTGAQTIISLNMHQWTVCIKMFLRSDTTNDRFR